MFSSAKLKPGPLWKAVLHLPLAAAALATIIPMMLLVSTSLSTENDVIYHGYPLITRVFSLFAYQAIFQNYQALLRTYLVTIAVTLIGAVLSLLLTAMIGYAISRHDFKYRGIVSLYVFFTMLFNGGIVPTYILIARWLHLKDNLFAMIVPMLVNAYFILLMKGYMQAIPFALIESAKIDSASERTIFFRIILPLSKPALATVGLFLILAFWNDWYNCMLYIDDKSLFNLQYTLIRQLQNFEFMNTAFVQKMLGPASIPPVLTARMALSVVAAGPMLFIFPFFQKYFVKGITVGSLK